MTPAELEDVAFWRALFPEGAVEGDAARPAVALPELSGLVARLREEGYLNLPGVLAPAGVARLRRAVEAVTARGLPPVFAWVFDDSWHAFAALAPLLAEVLGPGYRVVPDFWAWYVPPSDDAAGWRPHRDRARLLLVDPDGSPHSLTLWLALSDATPLNGCISLLPMHLDEDLQRLAGPRDLVRRPQDVRAQPAPAGSLLAWNHSVLHWGGRASRFAGEPRISLACEFQRASVPPLARPLLPPEPPSFLFRLWLVCRAMLGYRHMESLAPAHVALAQQIQSRHYERFANG